MYPHNRFIQSYCHQGRIGVLIEFGLETCLVTQQEAFLAMSRVLAMHVAASNPDSVDSMLSQPFTRDPEGTVAKVLAKASAQLGEKITITRVVRWDQEPKPPTEESTPPRSPAMAARLKRAESVVRCWQTRRAGEERIESCQLKGKLHVRRA